MRLYPIPEEREEETAEVYEYLLYLINSSPATPDMSCFCKPCRSISVGF